MKTLKKLRIFVLLPALCICCIVLTNSNFFQTKYELIKIFEKPINALYLDSTLNFFSERSKYKEDYITIVDFTGFSLAPDIPSPGIVTIDSELNFYITNAYDNMKIYDSKGKFLKNIEYPVGYNVEYQSLDNINNLYLFLKKTDSTNKKIVLKSNLKSNLEEILTDQQVSNLNKTLLPPENFSEVISKKNEKQGMDGVFFDLRYDSKKIKTIFSSADGRYISPSTITVYRQEKPFVESETNKNDNNKFEVLNVSEISTDRVISLGSYVIDRVGNIYLSGVRSNKVEKTKVQMDNVERNAFKAMEPVFFIYKLEKK